MFEYGYSPSRSHSRHFVSLHSRQCYTCPLEGENLRKEYLFYINCSYAKINQAVTQIWIRSFNSAPQLESLEITKCYDRRVFQLLEECLKKRNSLLAASAQHRLQVLPKFARLFGPYSAFIEDRLKQYL